MTKLDGFRGAKVLVTGHTGFKGAWLCEWLNALGAHVTALALPPPDDRPSLFADLDLAARVDSRFCDIRDPLAVAQIMNEAKPDIVLHLAAQALVRPSYAFPIETFDTNVMGTAHVLQAAGDVGTVKAIVCVTTDKVYHNNEWLWPYRENDRLGGHDPYSASKAAAEIVAAVYRDNLFANGKGPAMATARGGNVIGGGDWSKDRLIPDIVRFVMAGDPIVLRSPKSVRPWQHVLELCRGYLMLAQALATKPASAADAWNFGPGAQGEANVETVVRLALKEYGRPDHEVRIEPPPEALKESKLLRLDISKAEAELDWRPIVDLRTGVAMTMQWYAGWAADRAGALALTRRQIADYQARM